MSSTISQTATPSFVPAPDGVDPAKVPFRVLHTGARIPGIGLGTFGSDRVSGEQIAEAVLGAAFAGYRHFDCAAVYGNEKLIGHSLQQILKGGVRREELWITSKLWNDKHAEDEVIPAFENSLEGSPTRLFGSLPDSLAVSELSPARMRCRFAKSGCEALRS